MKRFGWLLVNAAQAIFLCVWSAFWITAALLVILVTLRREHALAMARRFWGPGLLWASGTTLRVEGADRIDWSKPHIFALNHQSMLDVPVAFVALRCNVRFIAKQVLAFVPFLGWYMTATSMIFVDRGNSARARESLRRAGAKIRQGASILAFPEGTRSLDDAVLPFKKGAFVVALEAQVPVVPVAIYGARQVLPANSFRLRPGLVRVCIGEPIGTADLGYERRDEVIERVRSAVVALYEGARRACLTKPNADAPVGDRAPVADGEPPARG